MVWFYKIPNYNRSMNESMNVAFCTKESPKSRLCPSLIKWLARFLYFAQDHRQHCTLHAFAQFRALYMDKLDEKYSTGRDSNPVPPSFKPQQTEVEVDRYGCLCAVLLNIHQMALMYPCIILFIYRTFLIWVADTDGRGGGVQEIAQTSL